MATLFGDDGGSIFAARKAMKKKPEEQQKPQETRQKRSKPKLMCIYQTNATVQTVNQSTNQANDIGNCAIGVFRSEDDYLFKIIDSKRKEIANIPINVETRWKYNNSKQCLTYDEKAGQLIINFPDESTTQIFSIFAVLTKAQQYNGIFPVKIEGSAQSSSCPIHFLSIDISKKSISPHEIKDNYIPPQESLQAQFANNNAPGSAGVYKLSANLFAFIQVLERTEEPIEEGEEVEETSEGEAEGEAEAEVTEAVGDEEEEIVYEEEVIYEEEPEIDSEKIINLQNEVRLRLNQLSLMIKSLKPNPIPMGKITVSNVTLLHDIRCAITAAKQKDQAIEKLQFQIDKFGDTLTQIKEKEEMKKMIEKIKDDITGFKEIEEESENFQQEKRKTIEKLNEQINSVQNQLLKNDEELLADEFENIKKIKIQMEQQLKKEAQLQRDNTDTLAVLREQVIELNKQNEELRSKNAQMPKEEEIEKEKTEMAAKLKEVVQQVAVGTLQLVQSNLQEEGNYNGATVKSAIQTILQRVNNTILGIKQEEEEQDEANEEDQADGENENEQNENNEGEDNEAEAEGEGENENNEDEGENNQGEGEDENGDGENEAGTEEDAGEGQAEEDGENAAGEEEETGQNEDPEE